MAKDILANLNCDSAVLSADNLSMHLQFLQQAIRDRTRLISALGFGIVDTEDPRYQISTEAKPLWVDFTPQTYTKVVVSPGKAVTSSGDIISIEAPVIVDVAALTPGVESLIVAQYTEVDSQELGRRPMG